MIGKNWQQKFQQQRKNVIVNHGISIHGQTSEPEKGKYFPMNREQYKTICVNSSMWAVWRVSLQDQTTGATQQFRFYEEMWIGRGLAEKPDEVRLVLARDTRVSKNHCRIYEENNRLILEDLNSKNHTYVNGVRINSPVVLQNGDMLKIGGSRFRVEFGR